jgi:hypothetical protein
MREWAVCFTDNSLRISLRRRRIFGRAQGNELALPSKTALELIADFLSGRRILGASVDENEEREEKKGLHLEMLMSETCFARNELRLRATRDQNSSGR